MDESRFELTVDKILKTATRNNPDQVISDQGNSHITYREFSNRVEKIAKGLIELGLKKGETVAVLDWDTLQYLECYYAIPMAGGVIHTVNIRYPPDLILYTMQQAEDRFVIVGEEFVQILKKSVGMFDFVKKWIVNSEDPKLVGELPEAIAFNSISGNDSTKLPELKEDDRATVFHTSGTTGMPKGVTFSHRKLVLHSLAVATLFADDPVAIRQTDVAMPLVPMFHVHSWGNPYTFIMKGMKYVVPGRYDFNKLPGLMQKEHVNVSFMVPSILYMLISNPNNEDTLKGLGLKVLLGGSAVSRGLYEKAKQLNIQIAAGYGMSETAPVISLSKYNHSIISQSDDVKGNTSIKAGIPLPLVDLRVMDLKYKEVRWDSTEIGEVMVRAPWLTEGYLKDQINTEKLWSNGWLHTGDLATVDKFGYVSIVDREKDAVKSGGEFIPTIILEDCISTFKGVGEVAVIGRPDDVWDERPIAFISGLKEIDKDKLKSHLMEYVKTGKIQKFWIPDEFIAIETFPKTGTGKIDKKALRKL